MEKECLMKSLKLITVAIIIVGMSGCLSFRSESKPGPQGSPGPQGAQGPAGSSERVIVVPEKSY